MNPYSLGSTIQGKRLAQQTFEILHLKFPGYTWMIGIDLDGGILDIWVHNLPSGYGFTEHISKWSPWRIIRAGGEVLERWNVSRSRANQDEIAEIRARPLLLRRPEIG